jgi:DNA-binding CsgD family transcriptional regulator
MSKILSHLSHLLNNAQLNAVDALPEADMYWAISAFLNPGRCYYYIFDLSDAEVTYVHPEVRAILGCDPGAFSMAYLLRNLHPEDAASFESKFSTMLEFFQCRIPRKKMFQYKACYTFRVRDRNGRWLRILQQYVPLGQTSEGRIEKLLGIHTSVSGVEISSLHTLEFIGLHGEPSFQVQDPEQADVPVADPLPEISEREKTVVLLLAEGLSSKQIADRLYIAKSTVDSHRHNLLRKTGAKNTLELAIRLLQNGMV